MILMLIKGESTLGEDLGKLLAPYGISVVHYRNPIKAMDNFEELRPRIVLYDLQDFPRHWKILIKYLREEYAKDQAVFLLFSEARPPLEEANKALFLGVNGLLNFDGKSEALARSIREVFLRYGTFDRTWDSGEEPAEESFGFVFRHPKKKHLVTGCLTQMEESWAIFKPDFPHEIADLVAGDQILSCSLRLQERLISMDASVVKNTGALHLKLEASLGDGTEKLLAPTVSNN